MPASGRRTGGAWLLAATVLALANPFLHKTVSDVCDWARARWGFSLYDRSALVAIPLVSVLVVAPFVARKRHLVLGRRFAVVGVLVLAVMTLAAQRWLLVANIELIHFPQFALLAVLLLAAGVTGLAAFLIAAVAGVLDETYQYFVVYAGIPGIYFDINDIVLNTIGAAWGVALFGEMLRRDPGGARAGDAPQPDGKRGRRVIPVQVVLVFALLALLVALWLDPPSFSPLLRATDSGRALFRVLSAGEGVVVCALLWGLVTLLVRDGDASAAAGRAAQARSA